MCKSCDCDNYEKCSIVGYQPIGFCCTICNQYIEHQPCIHECKEEESSLEGPIELISSKIEKNILIVSLRRNNKDFQLKIDLKDKLR